MKARRTRPDVGYTMYRDGEDLVCHVGATPLTYYARAIDDLHAGLLA